MDDQEFPVLGTQRTARNVTGPADPDDTERDRRPCGHPIPASRDSDRGMRPAGKIRSFREGNCNVRARGVQEPLASHLSPLADSFNPRPTSKEQKNQRQLTNYDLDRSPARTGLGETEIPWDSIQNEVATIGTAKPIEIGKPVAMADVAVPSGPAGTGAGGPVATEISMTTVTYRTEASGPRRRVTDAPFATELCSQTGNDRTEAGGPAVTVARGPVGIVRKFRTAGETTETEMATGTGTGGTVVTGTQFLAVAEVHAPIAEKEGNQWSKVRNSNQITEVTTEMTSPTQLEHISSGEGSVVETDGRGNSMAEDGTQFLKPEVIRGASDREPVMVPCSYSSNKGMEAVDTVNEEAPAAGDTIMVGVVGSAAPWFLTGWTNDVEVEFMIDTGCQVTILATSVFERMCDIHPEVRNGLIPCAQRLVSADSSPLTVMGRINLNVVFPGLECDMWCVVASIGTDGLLGTEALQSCLPHQLDLRTGQLWANGRSTLQLHQQKSTPLVTGSLITAVVIPPDSEVVATFSISGGQLGACALIDPNWDLTEQYGVLVGHTLVDATTPAASVLIINPNAEEVVLPCGSSVGNLVPVLSVSMARSTQYLSETTTEKLPEYLEDIVRGAHASLGDTGRQSLRDLLHKYEHVFPAPGEPVTGHYHRYS